MLDVDGLKNRFQMLQISLFFTPRRRSSSMGVVEIRLE